jgi:hypothetical protein
VGQLQLAHLMLHWEVGCNDRFAEGQGCWVDRFQSQMVMKDLGNTMIADLNLQQ